MAYCQGNLPELTEVCDRRPRNLSGDHVSDSCILNVEPLFPQFCLHPRMLRPTCVSLTFSYFGERGAFWETRRVSNDAGTFFSQSWEITVYNWALYHCQRDFYNKLSWINGMRSKWLTYQHRNNNKKNNPKQPLEWKASSILWCIQHLTLLSL